MTASEKKQFLAQYEEIHDSLMRFCIVKSRGIMDPKDLANDVLLVGMENYHKLNDKKALLSYLFTTANRICMNKVRRKKFDGHYDETMAANISDPNNNVDKGVDIAFLYAALDQLPPLQKEAVTLFEISDLPIKEIMVIQNSKASAVKQRIKRGREKLAELLKEKDRKKIAVVATSLLLTSNSFGMSNLDAYFQAVKDLPLPLSKAEAVGTITKFSAAGAATNATATKIGSVVLKKTILGSVVVGGVIGTTVLLSSPSEAQEDTNGNNHSTELAFFSDTLKKEKPVDSTKTISYETILEENPHMLELPEEELNRIMEEVLADTLESDDTFPEETEEIEKTEEFPESSSSGELLEGDTFPIASVETVSIDHLGGNIEVMTWDRDEVKIITNHRIIGKTPEDEALIKENLDFKVEKQGSTLTIKNNTCGIKKQKINGRKKGLSTISFRNGKKAKFKVLEMNYTIMMPADVNLSLLGNYENITVPDMNKDVTSRLFHCNLKLGSVGGKADIKLHYSKAEMADFNEAQIYLMDSDITFLNSKKLDLTAKYSDVTAGEISGGAEMTLFDSDLTAVGFTGNLNGNIKYASLKFEQSNIPEGKISAFESKMTFPNADKLDIEMRYSSLTGARVKTLNVPVVFECNINYDYVGNLSAASSKYSEYKIGELGEKIEMSSFEDDLIIKKTKPNLSGMTFSGKYCNYTITLAQPADYQLDFDGNYGNLDYGDLKLTLKNYEKTNEHKVLTGFLQDGDENSPTISFDCFESKIKLN